MVQERLEGLLLLSVERKTLLTLTIDESIKTLPSLRSRQYAKLVCGYICDEQTERMATYNTVSTSNGVSRDCQPFVIKLVLLGEEAVGKSCLVERFVYGRFDFGHRISLQAAHLTQTVNFDNRTVKFDIWDTRLLSTDCRNPQAAIIVYDITKMSTFDTAKRRVMELKHMGNPNIVIALSGNKADLTGMREVEFKEAQGYAEENDILFMETSALTDVNASEIFVAVAMKMLKTMSGAATKENNTILLHLASQKGHHDAVQKLLKSGANVNIATCNENTTALYVACQYSHHDVIESLLAAGADVNIARSNDGWSPLMVASRNGHFDVVMALIGAGAKVSLTNKDGWSSLMIASKNGHLDVVMALIGAGAEVSQTNKDRQKALDIAVKNGHKNIVELLKTCQAKILSIMAKQQHDIRHQKKQTEQLFHDMFEKKEQELRDIRQQKQRAERELKFVRQQMELEEQHFRNVRQQQKLQTEQLQDLRQGKEQAEKKLEDVNKQTEQLLLYVREQQKQIEQLFDVRQQKEQAEHQLHDMRQQKEQAEQQLHDMKQQKEQAEQQLHDMRQQKEQAEQQLQDVRQQKSGMKEQIDDYEKRLKATESIVVKMQLKNASLLQADSSQITQTENFIGYNLHVVAPSVSENSSNDENEHP
ncbi:hypothetical protein EMCRGX_G006895 [Ephydatia muelleri]